MTDYKKIVFSCFLIFGMLISLVFGQLLKSVIGYFDLYVYGNVVEILERILPIAVGLGTFFGLHRSSKSTIYMTEVISELHKVTWQGWKEVQGATLVVVIAVLLASALLGLIDSLWSFVIRTVMRYGV